VSYYLDSSDEYGYDRNSMSEEPDPLGVQGRYEALVERRGMSHADAMAQIAKEWEKPNHGGYMAASDRYLSLLQQYRKEGLDDVAIRKRLHEDPYAEGLDVYYAPDPTRDMLPEHFKSRYVIWRSQERSQKVAAWVRKGSRGYADVGDTQDFVPIITDATGQELGATAAALAFVVHGLRYAAGIGDDVAEAWRVRDAAGQVFSDPFSHPIVGPVLSMFAEPPASARTVKLPPESGRFLEALPIFGNSIESKRVQVAGENPSGPLSGKFEQEYSWKPGTYGVQWTLGLLAKALMAPIEAETALVRSKKDPLLSMLGQRVYEASPKRAASHARDDFIELVEKSTPTAAQAVGLPLAPGETQRRVMETNLADALARGEDVAAIAERTVAGYRKDGAAGVGRGDMGVVRALLVEGGIPAPAVEQMEDSDVINHVERWFRTGSLDAAQKAQ
jgi:hypothetical protein